MSPALLTEFEDVRDYLRRSTLLASLALALGIALVPTGIRAAVGPMRWVLAAGGAAYVLVSAYRLLVCFQVDRQLGLEYRFLKFAHDRGRLLESALASAKIWRLSAIVQGLRRTLLAPVAPTDGPEKLERILRGSRSLLHPPSHRWAWMGWLAATLSWSYGSAMGDVRLDLLLILVLPVLLGLGYLEFLIRLRNETYSQRLDALLTEVTNQATREWVTADLPTNGRRFRHRVRFRDALRLG